MDELEHTPGSQYRGAPQAVGEVLGPIRLELRERGGVPGLGPGAEHRGGLGQRVSVRSQRGDAGHHARRDALGRHAIDVACSDLHEGLAGLPQPDDDLLDQERVAARRLVTRPAELVARALPQPLPHQTGDRGLAQQSGLDPARAVLESKLGKGIDADPGLARARRDRERQGHAIATTGQEGEKAQRRPIGPMGVVDDEQHRRALTQVPAQPVERVEQREVRVARGRSGSGRQRHLREPRVPG